MQTYERDVLNIDTNYKDVLKEMDLFKEEENKNFSEFKEDAEKKRKM